MKRIGCFTIALACVAGIAAGAPADLAFKSDGKGFFSFNTGRIKGKLRADNASQGFQTFVDVETGVELAHSPGLLNYYRLLSTDKRWGGAFRSRAKSARLLADGAVEVLWRPLEDYPVELKAVYRWVAPDTLDLETQLRPERDMKNVEVFLSSYFSKGFRASVYVRAPRHAPGKPHFLPLDATPFTVGTYLAFPRDLAAARMIYDGRWERGANPVQWSVNRFLAAPLAIRRNDERGISCVVMSRPEDCFAVEAPYDKQPPDGVAAHYSLYQSLFGRDLKAGQTARTLTRMVVGRDISDQRAVEIYEKFAQQTK